MALPLLIPLGAKIAMGAAAALGVTALASSKGCQDTAKEIGTTIDKTTTLLIVAGVGIAAYYYLKK